MTRKNSLLALLLMTCGSSFLFLASRQAETMQVSLPTTLLLIVTGTLTASILVSFLYRSSLFGRSEVVTDFTHVTRYTPTSSYDLSILSRLQYAVDQHSIISKTDVSGNIIYVNDLFEQVSGYKRDELIGRTHRVIKSDIHSKEFFSEMWKTISEGKIWQGEVCNQRKNGEHYWVESTIIPFVNERGNPYEYISVRTDISKLKNYEAALLTAKNEAEEANNIKSRFLSNISHELRTPLNAVMGFAQVLEMNESIDTEGKKYLKEIRKAGQYLVSLFDDLLDMGCVESDSLSLNMNNVCLHDILDECIHLSSMMASAQGLSLKADISKCELVYVNVDDKRLKQVILNLLTNAIKYNSDNGSVILQCHNDNNNEVFIDIIDTGVGLSEDEISQIFKPFVRVGINQNNIRGTGIGLALSKSIMQNMGGDITVESVQGSGSKFTVKLAADIVSPAIKIN